MNNDNAPTKWEAEAEENERALNDEIDSILKKTNPVFERLMLIEEDILNSHTHLTNTLKMIQSRMNKMRDEIRSDVKYEMEDKALYDADIYAYHGVRRSDF